MKPKHFEPNIKLATVVSM